jgi:transposase
MQTATTIGLEIAKNVFQIHGIAPDDRVVCPQQLKSGRVLAFFKKLEPCIIGIEASATSHHWAREIGAFGHIVNLMPPKYVKADVKRQKNDAADAEAICEAVQKEFPAISHGQGNAYFAARFAMHVIDALPRCTAAALCGRASEA